MTNPYEQDLDRQPANFQPLTPITYLERAARTYPDHLAIVHGDQAHQLPRLLAPLAAAGLGAGANAASARATR